MSGTGSTRWYFTDWMSDPNVRACSFAARGIWMDMLCIAGINKGREHGFVLIAGRVPTNKQIARLLGGTEDEVESLLRELEENKVFNRDRRGAIYSRRMVRAEKYRGNGRHAGTDNPRQNQTNKKAAPPPIPIPIPIPIREVSKTLSDWPLDYRERFWKAYPRKTEKKAAMAKLDAVRDTTLPWATMMAGVDRYAKHVAGSEERYIKHPTTWLNRGCWDDEHQGNRAQQGVKNDRSESTSRAATDLAGRTEDLALVPRPSLFPEPRKAPIRMLPKG